MTIRTLWALSLDFYGREGVAAARTILQGGHGTDVNVVQFALWCAFRGCCPDAPTQAGVAVAPWRQSVV